MLRSASDRESKSTMQQSLIAGERGVAEGTTRHRTLVRRRTGHVFRCRRPLWPMVLCPPRLVAPLLLPPALPMRPQRPRNNLAGRHPALTCADASLSGSSDKPAHTNWVSFEGSSLKGALHIQGAPRSLEGVREVCQTPELKAPSWTTFHLMVVCVCVGADFAGRETTLPSSVRSTRDCQFLRAPIATARSTSSARSETRKTAPRASSTCERGPTALRVGANLESLSRPLLCRDTPGADHRQQRAPAVKLWEERRRSIGRRIVTNGLGHRAPS